MRKFLAIVFTLTFALGTQASSVWKVTNGEKTLYLGGTLHLLSPSDYPLPQAYTSAYQASDILVFETDIGALSSPEFTRKSMQMLTYGDSGTLQDDVSQTTLTLLESHLKARGIPLQHFLKLKPAMVGITLSMLEFQRLGLTSQGVDSYFYTLSVGDGKPMEWFETPEQQLEFIAGLGRGEEDEYIQYTLQDVEKMPEMVEQMKSDWRSGNVDALFDASLKELSETYPEIYSALLSNRNHNWLPKLKSFLDTDETEFVLVGTLHMPGTDGVLTLLKQQGYQIEQIK
ncbi:TraB/GumN family protein [Alteromonas aestuariivivens]|uniref:TraB/GumN family protein n=1 Tax=Alteromonas aestuariivivens TaxID=1938339 RepID=A0A3D8M505_9ALTE|nr:TraB/GumN family protein [Alteromonas aestuariivivens]RDV24660.1 TraB/GumN family protein [Alteromonas aestuariivivens]